MTQTALSRFLFVTTALVGLAAARPVLATDVTPVNGVDPATLQTAGSGNGLNFIAGGDNLFNVIGKNNAININGNSSGEQLLRLTGSSITAIMGHTLNITKPDADVGFTFDMNNFLNGIHYTLDNTGRGDTIHFGTGNIGSTIISTSYGAIHNSGGGYVVNAKAVIGGNLSIFSTADMSTGQRMTGDILLGQGVNTISFTSGGTGANLGLLNGKITGSRNGADTIILNDYSGYTIATNGVVNLGAGIDTIKIETGNFLVKNNVSADITTLGLGASGYTGASLTIDSGTYNTSNILGIGNNNKTITLNSGKLLGNINLADSGNGNNYSGTNNIYLNGGTFNGSINGGSGNDSIYLYKSDLKGAINGGGGNDVVAIQSGKHLNAISNIEWLSLSWVGANFDTKASGDLTGLNMYVAVSTGAELLVNTNIMGSGALLLDGTTTMAAGKHITMGSMYAPAGVGSILNVTFGPGTSGVYNSGIVLTNNNAAQI